MRLHIAMPGYRALMLFLALSMLSGCASYGPRMAADQLTIDKISSGRVNIGDVYARQADGGIGIVGKVKLESAMIGEPSDRMVVTIIGPDGKVLYTAHIRYYRYGKLTKESDTFDFSLTIPLIPPKGSIMRLMNEAPS